jgi:Prokaryotic E2 family E
MELPEDDKIFLNERGYNWSLQHDGAQGGFLIIHDFTVDGGGFTPPKTDLMIRIPAQYSMAPLDMWYCNPPIRIAATGQFVQGSEASEHYLGQTWQRFSRHLASGVWKPGIDNLRSFMPLIWRELQGYKG